MSKGDLHMKNLIWRKITGDKEVCDIIINSVIVGKLIIDKDPMDIHNNKWMCSFEGFPYRQIFCFDNKYLEMYGLPSKEIAKREIINQFKKIINTLYVFSSEILKQYLA